MKLNVENLKNELIKKEVLDRIKENILERFEKHHLLDWTDLDWEFDIIGTLGFSLSDIVVDFLETNKAFFENQTIYRWDVFEDKVLDSFVGGKFIEPFTNIECEPFFKVIREVSNLLKYEILNIETI